MSDPGGEFAPVLPALRARMPRLLSYGPYDPATRTGPALWLRAAADRRVPGVEWAAGKPPVLYLPGVAREVLRGAEDCPAELALLVWFAVTGTSFGQTRQARDWTLRGFLAATGSPVALDIPEDAATRAALARAASRLFTEPVTNLHGTRWDAAALDGLLVANPDADMLAFIDGALTAAVDPDRFAAFAGLSVKRFGFDPRKASREDAAGRLAAREGNWAHVWERFAQVSSGQDEVVRLLGFYEPQSLFEAPDSYPTANAKAETSLRAALLALKEQPHHTARQAVAALEADHAWRRDTVWCARGQAKLAEALEHLAVLAQAAALPQQDAEAFATAYATDGWVADAATLEAMGCVTSGEDRAAVLATMRALYGPWLEAGALVLQGLAAQGKVPFARPEPMTPTPGTALIFVDGLRMDLGRRLATLLRERGAVVEFGWRWSGFPTVTATCKPLASPAAGLLQAGPAAELLPAYEGKSATKPVLVKAIEAAGWSTAATLLTDAPIWAEAASIDQAGEANGAQLLPLLPGIVSAIADTVLPWARQGRRVRVVTDHGFLLMPGSLEWADLPSYFVEPSGKARRVALLKDGAPNTYDALPWSWNPAVSFATARGARAFYAGVEYAHGGVSPQECVLPVLEVTVAGATPALAVEVRWRGAMVKICVAGGAGLTADIRLGTGTAGPTALLKGPKTLDDAGEANLGIDLDHEGKAVCIVVYRASAPGEILAMTTSKAGG